MREKLAIALFAVVILILIVFGNRCAAQQPEPPQITAIEPNTAVTSPGVRVTVVGAHLSPGSIVYFGGLQAREVTFINASALQAVTPYLRPGHYKLDLKSGEAIIHSDEDFTALPTSVDSTIGQAEGLAARKQTSAAISVFENIASTHPDYDVRAYAHYRAGQLYLAVGNYMEAGVQSGLIWDRKASMGVQSSWRYRVQSDEMAYSISDSNDHDTDLRQADFDVKWDVTENPEPRFWRALMSARFGKMEQARTDLKFVLAAESDNSSYRGLAAYIGVLTGDRTQLEAFQGQQLDDSRALRLLGQAAYIIGDNDAALAWWTSQTKIEPVWAKLDYLAGQKHVKYGQTRVGTALIAECAAVTPDSREGKEAKAQLAALASSTH